MLFEFFKVLKFWCFWESVFVLVVFMYVFPWLCRYAVFRHLVAYQSASMGLSTVELQHADGDNWIYIYNDFAIYWLTGPNWTS